MRTSILSRSVIAVATLAIGSAALAAPAAANGITRDMVLAAAAGVRADGGSIDNEAPPSPATQAKLQALVSRVCDLSSGPVGLIYGAPVTAPDGVDGVSVTAILTDGETNDVTGLNTCSFVAVAPQGTTTTFAGETTVTSLSVDTGSEGGLPDFESLTTSRKTYQLSGDVFASPAVQSDATVNFSQLEAQGLIKNPGSERVLTITKVADKKSKADKRAAKKKYERRIDSAKKAYVKALKKAGGNTAKRTTARMTYASKKASAKSRYSYSIANYKLVKTRSVQDGSRRFSVQANSFLFS